MLKYYLLLLIRMVTKILQIFPMNNKQILFYSYSGKGYSCSPKYIAELLERQYPRKYTIVWALNKPDQWNELENKGWKVIKYKSLKHIIYSVTSKVIVTNTGPFKAVANRNGQEIVNTWHGGGAYKKTGMDNPYKNKYRRLYNKNLGQAGVTLFISSSKLFTQYAVRGAFDYQGKVMECGLPRNDVLFDNIKKEKIIKNTKLSLGIGADEKVVLYAPTWRNYSLKKEELLDVDTLLKTLKEKDNAKWVFVFRGHNLSKDLSIEYCKNNIINATNYSDMQELLIAADVLISDYSSCIWDYSLMKKPAFLFVPDIKKYKDIFAFYTPVEKWGYPVAKNNNELVECIRKMKKTKVLERIEESHIYFGNVETGNATEKVVKYIVKVTI